MEVGTILIRLVPEKKGLILKHSEYEITSERYKTTVVRRYNDFVTLHSLLLTRFPYRMLPRLPPKQLMLDSLLEERRKGLQRWLQIIYQHPILGSGPMVESFLTDNSTDHQERLRTVCSKELDEYSKLSDKAELPLEDQGRLASSREMMRTMLSCVTRLRRLAENQAVRLQTQSVEMNEISSILKTIDTFGKCFREDTFGAMFEGFHKISIETTKSSSVQSSAIAERLNLLLDVLTAHSDLCDRVEKGIVSDHQRALSKMININKMKIKGVIRGSAAENVAALHEQEILQTGVVGSLGRKSAFSLQCVLEETSLAQKYLQILPSIMLTFSLELQKYNANCVQICENIIAHESDKR